MNKKKFNIKNFYTITLLILCILFFIISLISVLLMSKSYNTTAQAMEIDNNVNYPPSVGKVYNTQFTFDGGRPDETFIVTADFIAGGERFVGINVFGTFDARVSFIQYVRADNTYKVIYSTDELGQITESWGSYFKVFFTSDMIVTDETWYKFTRVFDYTPFTKQIDVGVYSMRSEIYIEPSIDICAMMDGTYTTISNVGYTQIYNIYTFEGGLYLYNNLVFGADGIRRGQSEVLNVTKSFWCTDEFYQLFQSYYEQAHLIEEGTYSFEENITYPQNILSLYFANELFAPLKFNSIDTNYNSIYFGSVVVGGSVEDSLYYSPSSFIDYSQVITVNYDTGGWINELNRFITVTEDCYVSTNFYNWFISQAVPSYILNGNYVWNLKLNNDLTYPPQLITNEYAGKYGYFVSYTNNQTFETTQYYNLTFEGNLVLSYISIVNNVPDTTMVYDYDWVNNSFRFISFVNYLCDRDTYLFVIENAQISTDWVTNGSFYETGYQNGYENGYNAGVGIGENTGYQSGYDVGYDAGYYAGLDTASNTSFTGMLTSVVTAPFNMLYDLLDFDILGYNMSSFFFSLLSLCFIIAVIRWLL